MIFNNSVTRKDLPQDLLLLDVNDVFALPFLDVAIELDSKEALSSVEKSFMHSKRLIAILLKKNDKIISEIGCLAKIKTFIEDDKDKVILGVRGICRFNFEKIYPDKDNIMNLVPLWDKYLDDLDIKKIKIEDRFKFQNMLDAYCKNNIDLEKIDYKKYAKISDHELFNFALEILEIDHITRIKLIEANNFNVMLQIISAELELRLAEMEAYAKSKH
jgi:Lon protease-like protein